MRWKKYKKKQPTRPAPAASTAGPCPTICQNSRRPRHWKLPSSYEINVKKQNIWTLKKIAVIILINERGGFIVLSNSNVSKRCRWNSKQYRWQSDLVFTVCLQLSVRKLKILTVHAQSTLFEFSLYIWIQSVIYFSYIWLDWQHLQNYQN